MYKKLEDERIVKKTNKVIAPMYVLILALTCIAAIIKYIFFTQEISNYILELVAIIGSIGYLIFISIVNHIPIFSSEDQCIKELQNKYRTYSFNICFCVYVVGEFILLLIQGEEFYRIIGFYLLIWFIPSIIITRKLIKKGLFVWGSKKRKKNGIKEFRKHCILGSLFYGVFMEWSSLWKNRSFNPIGIVRILGMAALWGIPFYFIMKLFMDNSEKNSDRELEKAEKYDG
ncbi:DUF6773 family protein [Clostridium botulinum]|uniref:DUF6773 family protein n=1 Tax=Clostridium botulinum TaxID=1491 RepID=UPI0009473B5D|nr:DUF6773 family protein [Clostridium botulinum]APQ96704.1 putative membrane protein [Clostridium botulinum]MBN3361422.1 hypothetical protein [Clostridium botulinum]